MTSPFARPTFNVTTPRLVLRTATAADAEAYLQLLATAENYPYEEAEQDLTLERVQKRIASFVAGTAKGENAFMLVTLRATGEIIGHGGFNCFELVDVPSFLGQSMAKDVAGEKETPEKSKAGYMADIGIMIDHRRWRQGLGREAVCGLWEYAAKELGCEAFRTETGPNNEGWKATMRGMGMDGLQTMGKASYDANLEVLVWRFGAERWAEAREAMQRDGRWPLLAES